MNLEALFIIASVIGSIISTLTGNIFYVSAPLTLALLMNFLNRGKVQQTLTEVHTDENLIASVSQQGAETQKLSQTIDTKVRIEKFEKLEAQLNNKFELLQNRLAVISTELTEKLIKNENSTASLSQLGAETQKLSESINTKASTEKLEKFGEHLDDMSKSLQSELAVISTQLTEKLNKNENSIASLSHLGSETQNLSETINTKASIEKLEKLEERLDDTSNYLQTQLSNLRTELNTSSKLKTLDDKILKINSYLDSIVNNNFTDIDKNLLSLNRKFTFQQEQIERLISEIDFLKTSISNLTDSISVTHTG